MNQTFDVQGMTCQHCVQAVRAAVQDMDALAQVEVDLASGRVLVQSEQPRETLAQAIADAGYTVGA